MNGELITNNHEETKPESTPVTNFKLAARQKQTGKQNKAFLMHYFTKAVIQAEGSLWISLIVCDIQENSTFQMPRRSSPSARTFFHQSLITKPKDFSSLGSQTCFSHSLYSPCSLGIRGDLVYERKGAGSRMAL